MAASSDELWEEAWEARDRGDFAKLKSILLSIDGTHGHRVSYLVGLALAQWELGERVEAEQLMRELTRRRPDNEHFSLTLFHILRDRGREEDAFAEGKRFLDSHSAEQCQEYHRLIREWHQELFGD